MSLRAKFYIALSSSVIVIAIHLLLGRFYLYWSVPNVDIPMHILGGLMTGFYALWLLEYFEQKKYLVMVLIGVLLVGMTWELLEVFTMSVDTQSLWYPLDTTKDLIDDIVGGIIAYFIWRKI